MMNKMETTTPRQDVHCAHRNNRVIDREGEAPAEPRVQ